MGTTRKIEKSILKRAIIPIIFFGVIAAGAVILFIGRYVEKEFYSNRYAFMELIVGRAAAIAEFQNKGLQEFEGLGLEASQNIENKIKVNAVNSIETFVDSFKKNDISILIVEGNKVVFNNSEYKVSGAEIIKDPIDNTAFVHGKPFIIYSAVFKAWNWEIYGLTDKTVFMGPIYKLQGFIIITTVIVISLLLLFVAFAYKSKIYNPLYQLMDSAERITSGELRMIEISTAPTEFTVLAESFNVMIGSLNDALKAKDDYAARLKELNVDLENIVEERTRELSDAYKKLQKLNEKKSEFVSFASHELRTPITSIIGFANLVGKKLADVIIPKLSTEDDKVHKTARQMADNMKIIISEGERLTSLINDILDLAKMEAGKVEWKMEPVYVSEAIERGLDATSSLFEHKGLELIKDVDNNLPNVNGDVDKLIQVVINLISNAVKFTEKGSVTCRASKADNDIVVSVIDTGIGIAKEHREAVFEKYKQIDNANKGAPKGTGLGLPICKEIIEHHGGKIWAESNAVGGSNFSFTLPIIQ